MVLSASGALAVAEVDVVAAVADEEQHGPEL